MDWLDGIKSCVPLCLNIQKPFTRQPCVDDGDVKTIVGAPNNLLGQVQTDQISAKKKQRFLF